MFQAGWIRPQYLAPNRGAVILQLSPNLWEIPSSDHEDIYTTWSLTMVQTVMWPTANSSLVPTKYSGSLIDLPNSCRLELMRNCIPFFLSNTLATLLICSYCKFTQKHCPWQKHLTWEGTYLTFCNQNWLPSNNILHALDWNALCEVTSHTKSPTMKAIFSSPSANRLARRKYLRPHY